MAGRLAADAFPMLADIVRARPHVYAHLQPTPLRPYPGLSKLLGADVFVKHENHLPTSSFKVRGGIHFASTLSQEERERGIYTASSGNHGQSIAFAGRAVGARVIVAVPHGANPTKIQAMRDLGAEVIEEGADFDEAREWITKRAEEDGAVMVTPTDPSLICGVGTYGLEIIEALPHLDVVIVPVGAGSGACGCSISIKSMHPAASIIGVQASEAPTMQRTWQAGHPVPSAMATRAEGLQTRVLFDNTQRIMRDSKLGLDDFLLVEDAEMDEAIRLLFEHTRNLAEHAGAAALAAALKMKDRLRGKQVVLVMSGGNLGLDNLRKVFF